MRAKSPFRETYPLYLAGQPREGDASLEVKDKYDGSLLTRVALAGRDQIDQAIAAADAARGAMSKMPSHLRRAVLEHCVRRLGERKEELAAVLCREAGKPIRDSRGEVARLIDTFRAAAEEVGQIEGRFVPLDGSARGEGYMGVWKRVPVGPCSFITPFNFPLNLAAHKIAPAIAAGCPFVLKPASATPVSALLLGELLAETSLPVGAFSILPCRSSDAEALTSDERLKLLSFTGSAEVGWGLKAKAGKKKVVLELGGNAACIVDETADLTDAASRLTLGAFYQSGQSCISVQRIFAHDSVYDSLRDRLINAAGELRTGDPSDESVSVGPLIDEKEARRIEGWVESAVRRGARVLCGGKRRGALYEPTYLEDVPEDEKLMTEEAFGPVACLSRFRDFRAVLGRVNASRYGLQAGLFTRDLDRALTAWDEIEAGGVLVNEVPSWRVDPMPYGGVKDSGLGREGLKHAIEDMTEIRLLVVRKHPL